MKIATRQNKEKVVSILMNAFDDNKSVNYIVKPGKGRESGLRFLMEYSFELCLLFGKVYLSENEDSCALLLDYQQKRTSLKTFLLDLLLIHKTIGYTNIPKVLKRESTIKKNYPKDAAFIYLWFIGVNKEKQGQGSGTKMLNEIIRINSSNIYLETSNTKNLPWYQKNGFQIYNHTSDFGYDFYFLRRINM